MKSIKSFLGIAIIGLLLTAAQPSHASPVKHKTELASYCVKCFDAPVEKVTISSVYLDVTIVNMIEPACATAVTVVEAVKPTEEINLIRLYPAGNFVKYVRPPNLSKSVSWQHINFGRTCIIQV